MHRQAAALFFLYGAAALAFGAAAFAQGDPSVVDNPGKHAGVYLCIPEVSGGLRYDEQAKQWKAVTFKPGDNVIFKLTDTGDRNAFGTSTPVAGYAVTVNIPGEQKPRECYPRVGKHVIADDGHIMCFSFSTTIYKLDLTSMRYMDIYATGYVDGADNPNNTPSITAGKCSKIE